MTIKLSHNSYGKSDVRLVKVTRNGQEHRLQELTVTVILAGDFSATYLTGDNRAVLPTDTIKNTVYVLAKDHPLDSIEEFAIDLSRHFQERLANVDQVTVDIVETSWQRMVVAGELHPYAFTGTNTEKSCCTITHTATEVKIESSIRDLLILKTTGSGFAQFLRDEYTTLKETDDRLLGTNLLAQWHYKQNEVNFVDLRTQLRQTLIEVFATHPSNSLQNTLYEMGKAALEKIPELADIHLFMPNKHNLLVDLSPFHLENPNQIFMPIDEPYGMIEGRLQAE